MRSAISLAFETAVSWFMTIPDNTDPAFSTLMLSDPLHRINTTSFGHGKLFPCRQRVRHCRKHYVIEGRLVTSRESIF
jgi:hypothetical protein